jgi:hypothetical protein
MKLDKDTYLLSLDLFIRRATTPTFKADQLAQLATECIRQSVAFHAQWSAMEEQVRAASTQAVEAAKPTVQPLPRKGDGEREKLPKAPVKPLRAKAPAKRKKAPAKALKAKRKAKR